MSHVFSFIPHILVSLPHVTATCHGIRHDETVVKLADSFPMLPELKYLTSVSHALF